MAELSRKFKDTHFVDFPVSLDPADDVRIPIYQAPNQLIYDRMKALAETLRHKRQVILAEQAGQEITSTNDDEWGELTELRTVPNATLFLDAIDMERSGQAALKSHTQRMFKANDTRGSAKKSIAAPLCVDLSNMSRILFALSEGRFHLGYQKGYISVFQRDRFGDLTIGTKSYPVLAPHGRKKSGLSNKHLLMLSENGLDGASYDALNLSASSVKVLACDTRRFMQSMGFPFIDVRLFDQRAFLLDYSQAAHWQKHLSLKLQMTARYDGYCEYTSRAVLYAERTFPHGCRTPQSVLKDNPPSTFKQAPRPPRIIKTRYSRIQFS